jgi:sec-independent protein translocase protein TatA
MVLAFIGSAWQWLLVLGVVLLLFGNRLPLVARSLGRSLTEFKKGINDVDDDSPNSQIDDKNRSEYDEQRASRERVVR